MRVRVGWPMATLAALVVGYVGAAVVVPLDEVTVPCDAGSAHDAESRTRPPEPLRPYEIKSSASATGAVQPVEVNGGPPPLRGCRGEVESADRPDLTSVSEEERDRIQIAAIRQYLLMERDAPAAAR